MKSEFISSTFKNKVDVICELILVVTSASFAVVSLPVNGVLTYLAYKFYQKSDSASSR